MSVVQVQDKDFMDAMKKHKKEQQEAAERRSYVPQDQREIQYSALEKEVYKFIRILGVPIQIRDKDPKYSPMLTLLGKVANEKGRKVEMVFPYRQDQPNWILYKVMDMILEKEYTSGNEVKFVHSKDHPRIFGIVNKNGVSESEKPRSFFMEKGWTPSQYVIMNVIDRAYMDWHKKNQHSLILSKKASPYTKKDGTQITIYEPGIPYSVYGEIMGDDIAGTYGNWQNYDVVIRKLDTKQQPFYAVYHPEEKKKFFAKYDGKDAFRKVYPFFDESVHTRPLTEEEANWERYDILDMYKVTPYRIIDAHLGNFFKMVDEEFETKFYEELQDLLSKETVEEREDGKNSELPPKDEEKKSSVSIPTNNEVEEEAEDEESVDETIEETKEESVKARPRKRSKPSEDESSFDLELFKEKGFVGIDKLTESEKAVIVGYDEANGTFKYDSSINEDDIYACVNYDNKDKPCSMKTPEFFHACPKCGEEFE